MYTSEKLQELWPYGFSTIGEVTFQSAAYVARYIMKKINGDDAEDHYSYWDPETGEFLYHRQPEYTTMSRRPGIGYEWYRKYGKHVRDHDAVIVNETKAKPPKYYDQLFEHHYPEDFKKVKNKRLDKARKNPNNSKDRLLTRMKCAVIKISRLKRNHDKGD